MRKVSLLVAASLLVAGFCLAGNQRWKEEFFKTDPQKLLAAAGEMSIPGDAGVYVLLDERRVTFDGQGRRTIQERMVYKIVKASSVEAWSVVERLWSPWYEQKPSMRARVITQDGLEHMLDPATIDDAPAVDVYEDVFSDQRVSQAPLPAVAAGAIIEEEIVTREDKPLYSGGVVEPFAFGKGVPVLTARLVIEAPAAIPIRYAVRLLSNVEPKREESDGAVRITFEAGPLDAIKMRPAYLPPDAPRWPEVLYATGKSWKDIAASYSELVNEQINASDITKTVTQVIAGAKERHQILDRLLAYINTEIRYTGVEFGDASLVPRAPAETLQRKYGDCKDKATLLVAMLRDAGFTAEIALLRAGPSTDVTPDLPGVGMFNHAIVFVPGQTPVWIDPTDKSSPVGVLPLDDQQRYALIADSSTEGLIKTPSRQSSDNGISQKREFLLNESGGARLIETTRTWGSIESAKRSSYDGTDPKDVQKWMEGYAKAEYLAGKVEKYDHSDPKDLTRPFEVRMEASGVRRGFTDDAQAGVAVFLSRVEDYLPSELIKDEKDEDEASDEQPKEPRKEDYYLPQPYTYELNYHIVPPPGYSPLPLPESKVDQLGPAQLTKAFKAQPDGSVDLTLHFDTVKSTYTADEGRALHEAVLELHKSDPLMIRFESTGMSHLSAGRIRESLEEFRRLSELHPKEGRHHAQAALALLAGALGESARLETKTATLLEPNSAYSHRVAGWVLQHDLLGRRFLKGFDRPAAIAEYRKALELDPDDTVAHVDLAILLEHNDRGIRYAEGASLPEAVEEYRKVEKKIAGTQFEANLPIAMMWARQFEPLKQWARKSSSVIRDQMLLVAIACTEGEAAALREARQISEPERRRTALTAAGAQLMQMRIYDKSVALLEEAAQGSTNAAALRKLIDVLHKIKPFETLTFSESDPASFVRKFTILSVQLTDGGSTDEFVRMMPKETRETLTGDWLKSFARAFRNAKNSVPGAALLSTKVLLDLGLAISTIDVDGTAQTGYRVRVDAGDRRSVFYLVVEDGACKLLVVREDPSLAGAQILKLVNAGDLKSAQQWLDWLRDDAASPIMDDPLSGPLLSRFWKKGTQGTADELRLAAAALLAKSPKADLAIPILQAARKSTPADIGKIDIALVIALTSLKKFPEALEIANQLEAQYPESSSLFLNRAFLNTRLSRWKDLRQLGDDRMKLLPEDPLAIRILIGVALNEGDYATIAQLYSKIFASGKETPVDHNDVAWYALFKNPLTPDDLAKAIEEARKSVEEAAASSNRHTLATLYAEAGDTAEALQVLYQSLEDDEPQSHHWYVIGRLAEQYGVTNAAITAYRKVERPAPPEPVEGSTYMLAQRRLAQLHAAPTSKRGTP